MMVTISTELEARLKQMAAQEGQDPSAMAELLLSAALDWEAQERAEAIAGIRRGLDASAAGRVGSAADVFEDMRAKLPHVAKRREIAAPPDSWEHPANPFV